jgi:hypothetical protein
MNRRKWLRIMLLAAITVAGCAALLWWHARPRISQEIADRIQEGMTEAQVVDIVGLPPGAHCSERSLYKQMLRAISSVQAVQGGKLRIGRPGSSIYRRYWIFEDRLLQVDFDHGRCLGARYHETPIGFWDWVRGVI